MRENNPSVIKGLILSTFIESRDYLKLSLWMVKDGERLK